MFISVGHWILNLWVDLKYWATDYLDFRNLGRGCNSAIHCTELNASQGVWSQYEVQLLGSSFKSKQKPTVDCITSYERWNYVKSRRPIAETHKINTQNKWAVRTSFLFFFLLSCLTFRVVLWEFKSNWCHVHPFWSMMQPSVHNFLTSLWGAVC